MSVSQFSGLISKEQSQYIKGIAIILMFAHHLFPFQNRYPAGAELIPLFNSMEFEIILGQLGKYCVPLFLFISGYGFSVSNKTNASYYLNKIAYIYKAVWLVFFIYIPIDIFFQVPRISLHIKDFILNFFAISSSYNGEWWFILPYILMVAITPLLQINKGHILSILALSFILHNVSGKGLWGATLLWQSSYILGFALGCYNFKTINIKVQILISVILAFIIWKGFQLFGVEGMIFFVPFLVFMIRTLYNISPAWVKRIIMELGDKCLFMWLAHSFYCYHFLGSFIYSPKYTMLILLNLLIVSYLSALVLNFLFDKWNTLIGKMINLSFVSPK